MSASVEALKKLIFPYKRAGFCGIQIGIIPVTKR